MARIFNTYGPRMNVGDGRVVSNFIVSALVGHSITVYGEGLQTRSFQYVDDLVDGLILLMNSNYSQPVNLGESSPSALQYHHFSLSLPSHSLSFPLFSLSLSLSPLNRLHFPAHRPPPPLPLSSSPPNGRESDRVHHQGLRRGDQRHDR